METIRLTTAQAIVKFLDNQYVSMDGVETKFVEGFFTIFGHGIAVGLGEALVCFLLGTVLLRALDQVPALRGRSPGRT